MGWGDCSIWVASCAHRSFSAQSASLAEGIAPSTTTQKKDNTQGFACYLPTAMRQPDLPTHAFSNPDISTDIYRMTDRFFTNARCLLAGALCCLRQRHFSFKTTLGVINYVRLDKILITHIALRSTSRKHVVLSRTLLSHTARTVKVVVSHKSSSPNLRAPPRLPRTSMACLSTRSDQ